jgi:hypothetical protein
LNGSNLSKNDRINRVRIHDEDVCCLRVLQLTIVTRMQVSESAWYPASDAALTTQVLRFETAGPAVRIAAVLLLVIVER